MPPTILLTRPEAASARFAHALRNRLGAAVDILIAPLTRIEWLDVALDMTDVDSLIFTSRNGVAAYLRATGRRDVPCFAVGDATAALAQKAGMVATSCQGDAEALIAQVLARADAGRVLHVRGRHSRGDVAARLTAAGRPTREVVMYDQQAMGLTEAAQEVLDGDTPVIVPLFSPRSAAQFVAEHRGKAPLLIAAMSGAVAEAAAPVKAAAMQVAARPDAEAMLEVLAGLVAKTDA